MASLRDQLLQQGLVNKKQVSQAAKSDKRKARDGRKAQASGDAVVVDEDKQLAQQAQKDKQKRDKALNAKREADRLAKELGAQVKQIISQNALRTSGELEYNFTDGKKIKKVYVDAEQQRALSTGRLAVVMQGDSYVLIPSGAAELISTRLPEAIISLAQGSKEAVDEDDPYADFQIPDDLMW